MQLVCSHVVYVSLLEDVPKIHKSYHSVRLTQTKTLHIYDSSAMTAKYTHMELTLFYTSLTSFTVMTVSKF